MEGNGRRLAWVAIALSVVALMVSLGGRAHSRWQGYYGPRGFDAPYGQMGPQGQYGPQGQFGPQGQYGPQGQFGPQAPMPPQAPMAPQGPGQFGRHGRMMGPQDQFGPRGRGGMPFFFFPLMLFGGLLKLLFVGALIFLGLRLIKGRGFGGPWGRGNQDPPRPSSPEQPPYTGDTQQM